MTTRNISNLANIASGFLSITEIPFWLNTSNSNQIVIMLAGRLQTCSVKTIYSCTNNRTPVVKIRVENIEDKPDYILAVSLSKLAIWLIPEHAIAGNQILRLGKCYEQYKYSIVDTALKHSKVKASDSQLKERATEAASISRGSKFNQISLDKALEQADNNTVIVDRS